MFRVSELRDPFLYHHGPWLCWQCFVKCQESSAKTSNLATSPDNIFVQGVEFVRTLESTVTFSTDEVERENAHAKRACHSGGPSRQHNVVVNSEVCRKLREYHMGRGGRDPALAKAEPACASRAGPSLAPSFLDIPRVVELPPDGVVPHALAQAGQHVADGGRVSARSILPVRKASTAKSRMGNPKLTFLNHKMSAKAATCGRMTKQRWREERKKLSEQWEVSDESQRSTWRKAFKVSGMSRANSAIGTSKRQRQELRNAQRGGNDKELAFLPVWQNHGVGETERPSESRANIQSKAMPIAEAALDSLYESLYGGLFSKLKERSGGASDFTIANDVPDRAAELDGLRGPDKQVLLWGCNAGVFNVCEKLKTPTFRTVTQQLSAWRDRQGKSGGEDASPTIIVCRGTLQSGARRSLYASLGGFSQNPKFQDFVVCKPVGVELVDGILCEGWLDPPFDLWMQETTCRLCAPSCATFMTLHHVTSDEVAKALTDVANSEWDALTARPSSLPETLMGLRIEAWVGDSMCLSKTARPARKVAGGGGLGMLAALRIASQGDPSSASTVMSGGRHTKPKGPLVASDPAPTAMVGREEDPEDFDLRLGIFDEPLEGHEDALADVVAAAEIQAATGVPDEANVESLGPDETAPPSSAMGELGPPPSELDALALRLLGDDDPVGPVSPPQAVIDVEHVGAAAGSSSDVDLTKWNVGVLGYVRHVDGDRDIGRVQSFKNGSNWSATCYQHSKCRLLKSHRQTDRDHCLKWLINAPVGSKGSAATHKALWKDKACSG